jgi:hypothetical protein
LWGFFSSLLDAFVQYIRSETDPQFATGIVRKVISQLSTNYPVAELLGGDTVPAGFNAKQLTETYALAAELFACQKSNLCAANRPYTMLQCMERSACVTGQSLSRFRQYWTPPIIMQAAQNLAKSWQTTEQP